jgi:DNA-binding transcriptional regulator YiaG
MQDHRSALSPNKEKDNIMTTTKNASTVSKTTAKALKATELVAIKRNVMTRRLNATVADIEETEIAIMRMQADLKQLRYDKDYYEGWLARN